MNEQQQEQCLSEWKGRQDLAEQMIPMIGKLYRDRGVVLRIYGRALANCSTIDILKAHRFVREFEEGELDIHATFSVLKGLSSMQLAPARIDLGKLTVNYLKDSGGKDSLEPYLAAALAPIVGGNGPVLRVPQDVVLYGFGRIGRVLARLLIERTGSGNKMRLRAIVVRPGKAGDLQKRAGLLRRDSVHGPFNGTVIVDEENGGIIANGNFMRIIYANRPEEIDYTQYGIKNAIVVDNTGIWKDREGLGSHLKSKGVAKVLLTAPASGDIPNVVYGVNHKQIAPDETIVSAASCTTNAITPVLKVMNDEFGIVSGHVETVHAYTNDQNLIDNYHKADRRGRSAALNMVITSTGAAEAVARALPELAGKLTGNAIRVPTPNVSMAVLNPNLRSEVKVQDLNTYLRDALGRKDLREQIDYTASTEIVSTDLVGSRHAGIIDSQATIANGSQCVLYVWYDNEFGYSSQVVRVLQDMSGIRLPNLPAEPVESQKSAALG